MSQPPKLRSIQFLTPEQLKRKRDGDRLAQRQRRERMKSSIETLEQQVQRLQQRNQDLEAQLSLAKATPWPPSDKRDDGALQSAPSGTGTSDNGRALEQELPLPETVMGNLGTEGFTAPTLFHPGRESEAQTPSNEIWQMVSESLPGLDFALWPGLASADENAADNAPVENTAPETQPLPSDNSAASPNSFQIVPADHVWAAVPKHTAPTCLLDSLLLDLTRRRWQQDNAREFQKGGFPSIQSLLNPCSEQQARASPVAYAIVNNIVRVMTVPTLPEQIAILYVISLVVRWLISPCEANYDAMPEWLRPGAAQLAVPHAPWLDIIPWPRARERFCRWRKYHAQHELVSSICNESLLINWPHQTADIILHCSSGEAVLNPIFDRHIKNVANWTIGTRLVQVFPELEGEVNVK